LAATAAPQTQKANHHHSAPSFSLSLFDQNFWINALAPTTTTFSPFPFSSRSLLSYKTKAFTKYATVQVVHLS